MTSFFTSLFELIDKLMSGLFTFLIVILIVGLIFAYLTKPTNESFSKFLSIEFNKQTQSRIITYLAKKTLDKEIRDYVFWKVARVRCVYDDRQKDIYFLGLFQTWGRME